MKNGFAALAALTVLAGGISFASATPADAQARGAPRGTYTQSCTGSYVNQGRLYADCYNRAGQMRATSIELNRCSTSDIGNDNGLLVCQGQRGTFERDDRPGNNNNRPGDNRPGNNWDNNRPGNNNNNRPGSGWDNSNASITVYRDSQYRGQSLTFNNSVSNLSRHGMNDAISSIRLSRGTWEVCEHADFRGRCEIIRSDVRDLGRINMNDKISSLRPVNRR